MTKATKEKTIENITYAGTQSVNRREIYMHGSIKIKLELKSDSIDYQSYARAYALDGLEWKLIYSIPYSEMKTRNKIQYDLRYRDNKIHLASCEFEQDVQRLKKYINEIL